MWHSVTPVGLGRVTASTLKENMYLGQATGWPCHNLLHPILVFGTSPRQNVVPDSNLCYLGCLLYDRAQAGSTILVFSVASWDILSISWTVIPMPNQFNKCKICITIKVMITARFPLIFIKITIKQRVGSFQLPVKFQLF